MTESEPSPKANPPAEAPKPVLVGPKRQHFLPRFYLEGFSQNGLVAIYDRETNAVRLQQPINTGVIGHYYTMQDEQNRKRFELEQFLSECEAKAKPAIDKLSTRKPLEAEERADLAIFVALGAMRTPDVVDSLKGFNSDMIMDIVKQEFAEVDDVAAWLRKSPEYAGSSEDDVLAEAKQRVYMVQNDGITVTTDHRWAVGMAIQMALRVAPILAARDWVILHRSDDKRSFITTDAPVLLTTVSRRTNNFWGIGFGSPDALAFFPLKESCGLAILGHSGDLRHIETNTEGVRRFNLAMAERCQRFLIGRDEALVRSLAQATRLTVSKWKPKMQRA